MHGIIFDFDGVLVDSMPAHYKAWRAAFDEVCSLHIEERSIYLLEGMRGIDIVNEIFKKSKYTETSKAQEVVNRKDDIFRPSIKHIRPYEGAADINSGLTCIKGIVSGSAKKDVTALHNQCFQNSTFNFLLAGDDIRYGKPNPQGFQLFLDKTKLDPKKVLVVENSPLGARASINAGLKVIVVLNNSHLTSDDFDHDGIEDFYLQTRDIVEPLHHWCANGLKISSR
jgi:HAD superfamily hydrolase (TIGR01509 family)